VRFGVAIAAAVLGASCRTAPTGPPRSRPAGPVKALAAHAGATALWHDGDLWVSFLGNFRQPGEVRLSRGDRPIQRSFVGQVAGVHAGRAIVVVSAGKAIEIQSIGATDAPIVFGRVPQAERDLEYGVTASGEAIIVDSGPRDAARLVRIVGPGGARAFPIVKPGAVVIALSAAPNAPRLALLLDEHSIGKSTRIAEIDTQTGRLLSETPLADDARASWIGVASDGAVWLKYHGYFARNDGRGERTLLQGIAPDARNIVIAPDGSAIAYVVPSGDSDMGFQTSPACDVYYTRRDDTSPLHGEALSYPTRCYGGLGLAIVDGTLWAAPPLGVAAQKTVQ